MSRARGRGALVLSSALSLAFSGCFGPAAERIPDTRTPYDDLHASVRPAFDTARDALDAGELEVAHSIFADLAARLPESVVVGAWLQETEIALARADRDGSGDTSLADAAIAARLEALRLRYREHAERDPTPTSLVLAARVEPDPRAAEVLLDAAAVRDTNCVWAHYGRAFLAAQASDWPSVRAAIARAKAADPGHLPTRWLEAWMLARGASVPEAIAALEEWLEKARGDRRLDRRLLLEAELDLALLSILERDPDRARALLSELDDPEVDQGRRWSAVASAEQAAGEPERALEAARAAERVAPGELLPLVQQALLYDLALEDHEAAEAAWTRVLAVSRSEPDLSALLERMRARVKLERFQAQREQRAEGESDDVR